MMQLLRTHDGLIGIKRGDKVTWCDSQEHATNIAFVLYEKQDHTRESIAKEIELAIDTMAQTNNTIAEFGVFGTFMYATTEDEQDENFF